MRSSRLAASVFVLLAFLAGALEAGDDDPFLYIIKDMTVFYDGNTGQPLTEDGIIRVCPQVLQTGTVAAPPLPPGGDCNPCDTMGFSMGVTHDDNYFDVVEITGEPPWIETGVVQSGVLLTLNNGGGPEYFG